MQIIWEWWEDNFGSSNDIGIGREGEGFCTEKTKIMILEKAVTSSGTDWMYLDDDETVISETSSWAKIEEVDY